MNILSKAYRILQQKPKHVIDASVLFGVFDLKDEKLRETCKKYLGCIGHKYQGFITIPLIGETFLAITKSGDEQLRMSAYDYLTQLIREGKLQILPISKEKNQVTDIICENHQHISNDDVRHLSDILQSGYSIFITLDEKLVGKKYQIATQKIKDTTGLEMYHPTEIINKLKL